MGMFVLMSCPLYWHFLVELNYSWIFCWDKWYAITSRWNYVLILFIIFTHTTTCFTYPYTWHVIMVHIYIYITRTTVSWTTGTSIENESNISFLGARWRRLSVFPHPLPWLHWHWGNCAVAWTSGKEPWWTWGCKSQDACRSYYHNWSKTRQNKDVSMYIVIHSMWIPTLDVFIFVN